MLSAEQLAKRKGKLTASRVACLIEGERDAIFRLWREMIGEIPEEDLSDVWPVQLGATTEPLQLRWYGRKTGQVVTRCGEVVAHPSLDWAACTLDGWDDRLACPIEVKHTGGFEPVEVIIDRYQPQMHWQMECTMARQCALSIVRGAAEPIVEYIDFEEDYAAQLVERGAQFMRFVTARKPPVDMPVIPAPIDATRLVDMTGNNEWAVQAAIWLSRKQHHNEYEDAAAILKQIMPPDAKKAFGYGVRITRDKAGRLSLRKADGVVA